MSLETIAFGRGIFVDFAMIIAVDAIECRWLIHLPLGLMHLFREISLGLQLVHIRLTWENSAKWPKINQNKVDFDALFSVKQITNVPITDSYNLTRISSETVLNDDDRVNGRPAALADASGLSDAQGIAYDLSIVLLTDLHRQANWNSSAGHTKVNLDTVTTATASLWRSLNDLGRFKSTWSIRFGPAALELISQKRFIGSTWNFYCREKR